MICYIIMTILGLLIVWFGIKRSKFLVIAGALLAAVGLFLVACTIILAYSVSHSEPKPSPDYENTSDIYEDSDTENLNSDSEDDELIGDDWRTWRSYTADYAISDDLTVCMAPYDDKTGFAVYDSRNGDRIGSLAVKNAGYNTGIRCEDIDGDGVKELGFAESADETVWYSYDGSNWNKK